MAGLAVLSVAVLRCTRIFAEGRRSDEWKGWVAVVLCKVAWVLSGAFAVKQWKVALFLAILGAIAAPFVTHTVKMRPTTQTWIPLTQDEKERISAEMSKTSNCRTLSEQFDAKKSTGIKPSVEDFMDHISRDSICRDQLKSLELGGYVESHPSILKYAAFNLASALAGFGIVFGAAMVIPFLIQRYWRGLNT